MWITPLHIAIAAAFVLTYIVVTRFDVARTSLTRIPSAQAAAASAIADELHDFEKEQHLVITPPVGTRVVLIADSGYLQYSHGAWPGHEGTVVQQSRLNSDDKGVLVNWGLRPNDRVRMDLNELRLSTRA